MIINNYELLGGVVPQETLDALVRGRDAQRQARKLQGKSRVSTTEMVSRIYLTHSRLIHDLANVNTYSCAFVK